MVRNFLFCLLFSFAGLSVAQDVPFTLSESDLICYNTLKEAVLDRYEADFEGFNDLFERKFPEPTQEAVEWLGCLVSDDIKLWQETHPPRTIVKVGTKEVPLYGTVGLIIYNATKNDAADNNASPDALLKDGDLVFRAIAMAANEIDTVSEKDLIDFINIVYKEAPHAFFSGQMYTNPLTKNTDPEIASIMNRGSMHDRLLVIYAVTRAAARKSSNTTLSQTADRLFLAAEVVGLLGVKQLLSLYEQMKWTEFLAHRVANS